MGNNKKITIKERMEIIAEISELATKIGDGVKFSENEIMVTAVATTMEILLGKIVTRHYDLWDIRKMLKKCIHLLEDEAE